MACAQASRMISYHTASRWLRDVHLLSPDFRCPLWGSARPTDPKAQDPLYGGNASVEKHSVELLHTWRIKET